MGEEQQSADDILNRYSRAVEEVVAGVAPAVVSIAMQRRGAYLQVQAGMGSGVVVSETGYILTNNHVVAAAQAILVRFMDGQVLPASVVGVDPPTDLAAIRVDATDIPYATLGDSDTLHPGEFVVALGNPLGFDSSVSTGVVSSIGRALRTEEGGLIENIIQHTAPLNPGSSGGALVNSRGEVVGINTAIIVMAQGIGFAIPSTTAKWVFSQLVEFGKVRRAHLGIVAGMRPLSQRFVEFHDLSIGRAIEILAVEPDGPAARAGIEEGDILLELGGKQLTSIDDLYRLLTGLPGGTRVPATVIRDRNRFQLTLTPTES
jgi:S1-C subfamily serine protease